MNYFVSLQMGYSDLKAGVLLACAKIADEIGSQPCIKNMLSSAGLSPKGMGDYLEIDVAVIRNIVIGFTDAPLGIDADYEFICLSEADGKVFAHSPCGRFNVDLSGYSITEANTLVTGWNKQLLTGR
ncbi:TPA: hypothetical protein UL576_003976 [Klebsiella pneumoniae]|uniref:hypothetical protein n=2 Tax=Enterobacterales TaxID=91347 RepID=UPI000FD75E3F|nr:hypothetical protein [Escherichia coli]MBG1882801.1 hypothetical protein [Klebsiella pneumoniae]HDS6013231.1 hypothetical protein [Klebsiella variicola]HED3474479.1 hypothetical protein [Klebsiella oxytoca]MDH8498550.1 hypothetical protein [Klebsiella pneumoniae]